MDGDIDLNPFRRRLRKHGRPAQALVVSIDTPKWQDASGSSLTHDYVLDVRPDDGSAEFRATVRDSFVIWMAPRVGHVLAVKFNPKSRKVAFDLDGDPRYDTGAAGAGAITRTPLGQAPSWPVEPTATPAPPAATPDGSGTLDQLERLTRLRDAGALTQAEFDAQKARILASS
jgi:hypothetical protein